MTQHINRLPGVSFVIRARNEARALFDNFVSLRDIKIPHEIVLVLHRCTDESKTVAEVWQKQGLPIRIIEDMTLVSRAGYETLVTPALHPNSLPEFYNRAFGYARYNWLFKWDADFVATDYLRDFINRELAIACVEPKAYRLHCDLGGDVVCHEEYLFNAWLWYGKHYCWEYCHQKESREVIKLEPLSIQSISPKIIKSYWAAPPWFVAEHTRDDVLAEKYEKLIDLVGPEPPAFARSNNPDFQAHWEKLLAHMPELEKHGIFATR
ncbi:MAG: hypothetical protein EBZ69_01000 [Alphaproteobacteria bacterium]|nr:hypothetical protein [Alphaproteobacteria bacterium]NDG04234.1 hypothetical protein [Alphaproteobacteria bacterium]